MNDTKSYISIIIPCRNEEAFIGNCLDSIVNNDYSKDLLEVLVVDGMSEDGTREIVERYGRRCPFIGLLENPKKITPCAFNVGIRHAEGDIIMMMSAHATYQEDYISKCVEYLKEYNADNVGGVMITLASKDTILAKSIALALSHPFGMGNSYFRVGSKKPRWVDTVFGGCYKREVFNKIGFFNESLLRAQDREFNSRLRKFGGRILLAPDIKCYYYARNNLKYFCKWIFTSGLWPFYLTKFTKKIVLSWRNLVPLVFVLSLVVSLLFSFVFPKSLWIFLVIISSYLLCNIYFSVKIVLKKRNIKCLLVIPLIFTTMHIIYGIGSISGLVKILIPKVGQKNG